MRVFFFIKKCINPCIHNFKANAQAHTNEIDYFIAAKYANPFVLNKNHDFTNIYAVL